MGDTNSAMSTSQTTGPAYREWGAAWFVWGVWAAMLTGALFFIHSYGCNLPFYDEWNLVGAVTGHQPVSFAWLWEQSNEHRIVLPKLIYLGLAKLTGCDFRAGMYFNGLALGALAGALILIARRLRGWTGYADAFFPLALLHAGHWENLLWSFQIEFITSTLLACVLLYLILRSRESLTWGAGLAGGLCLVALPLCGAHGLPLVPPLAVWLVLWAFQARQAAGRVGLYRLAVVALLAAAALALVPLYFIGYHRVDGHPPSPGWEATGKVALEFLTMSFGHAAALLWNYARFATVGLLLGAAAALGAIWWKRPEERIRILGLWCFLAGFIGLALGIGWGRAGIDKGAGFAFRYAALAVPVFFAVYFAFEIAGPTSWARFVQTALFTAFCACYWMNMQIGIWNGQERWRSFQAAEHDMMAHLPAGLVAQRHTALYPVRDHIISHLEWLRDAGVGKFKYLAPPVAEREIQVPVVPVPVANTEREKGSQTFALPKPAFVEGVRLKYTYADHGGPFANLRMDWRSAQHAESPGAVDSARLRVLANPGEHYVVIFVHDTIDRFAIWPDTQACPFRVVEVTLLVPRATEAKAPGMAEKPPDRKESMDRKEPVRVVRESGPR